MKCLKLFVVLFLFAAVASAQSQSKSNVSKDLAEELNDFRKTSLIPGFAVSIVNEKGVLYSKGFGVADVKNNAAFTPLTVNWVGSISKTFIALAVMKLVEQKKLSLDDPVNSILPYKIVNPNFPNSPITVRHLVTHTSSFTDSFEPYSVGEADVVLENPNDETKVPAYMQPNVDWHKLSGKISLDEAIRKFTQPNAKWYSNNSFLKNEPGVVFQYSNVAAAIAARIVEEKSGMSFNEFTKKYIFVPLKMKNTAWNFADLNTQLVSKIYVQNAEKNPTGVAEYPQYYSIVYPSGGLKTNVADLGKYLIEMIKGANGNGKLLNKETYRMMFEPQLTTRYLPKFDSASYPAGENRAVIWEIKKDKSYEHLGGNIGVYAFIKFNAETKIGSLAFCNLRDDRFGDIQTIVYKYEQKFSGR